MNFEQFCPYCSKMCRTYDSLIFYDNHCNYIGNDYFLPDRYRQHFYYINNKDISRLHIVLAAMNTYDIWSDRHNLSFTIYGDIWQKLAIIDKFEMHFYKPCFVYNEHILYIKNEFLSDNKKVNVHVTDDTQFEYKNHKRYIRNCEPLHGAIYRPNASHRLDLRIKTEFPFNKEISYIYIFNEDFSLFIFEHYINNLPPSAIALIRLFLGSTRYIIRNMMRRKIYFETMKQFNDKFRDKAKKNFEQKMLDAKPYVPSKFKKNPKI